MPKLRPCAALYLSPMLAMGCAHSAHGVDGPDPAAVIPTAVIPTAGETSGVPCRGLEVIRDTETGERILVEYGRCLTTGPVLIARGRKLGFGGATAVHIPPRFDYATRFSEGLAFVREGERYGYIDARGEMVLPLPKAATVLAGIREAAILTTDSGSGTAAGEGLVLPGARDDGCTVRVLPFGAAPMDLGPPVVFEECGTTGDGVVPGRRATSDAASGRSAGDTPAAEPIRFLTAFREGAGDFFEGLARVRIGALWGYIDKTGRLVIPPRFRAAGDFSGGSAEVIERGQRARIDRHGQIVRSLGPSTDRDL